MPKCPKCGEEITRLDYSQSGINIERVYLDPYNGNVIYDQIEFISDDTKPDIQCPLCFELLTTDDDEIYKLLKGDG